MAEQQKLKEHFMLEDIAKECLLESKNLKASKQTNRQAFLNLVEGQRKNLYIYPAKSNV